MTEQHKITLTHLNIRQSIAILLTKLIILDLLLTFIVIIMYFLLIQGGALIRLPFDNSLVFLVAFLLIGIVKIMLSVYIVLQWLNEYYEITPDSVIHKKGIIFRKLEQYRLDKVRAMSVQDTFMGELFNFATITLYDLRLNKYLDMYLIHNPDRYAKILQTLRPGLELKKDRVRLPFMPRDDDGDDSNKDS